jgi:DNA polymerase-3 subunit epsilon
LAEEFARANIDFDWTKCKFIDVQVLFMKMEPRTLSAAYKFYCNQTLENAHSAEADTKATYEILKSQLDRYPQIQNDITFLSEFTSHNHNVDFGGRIIFNDKKQEIFNLESIKDNL